MNFTQPISLDNFAKSCGISALSKTIFPYELYREPAELLAAKQFPKYGDFISSLEKTFNNIYIDELLNICLSKHVSGEWFDLNDVLDYYDINTQRNQFQYNEGYFTSTTLGKSVLQKQLHTSPKMYEESKQAFATNFDNMSEYMKEYNLNDVRILLTAIDAYTQGFYTQWQINAHKSVSLPGLAQKLAYKFYDGIPIFTFGENFKKYNEEIRKQLYGGCTMVFHRLIDLTPNRNILSGPLEGGEETPEKHPSQQRPYPKAAYESQTGKKYKTLSFLDFNSLYPKALSQSMPCGPGLLYEKVGTNFMLKAMTDSGKKWSKLSLEWLEYLTYHNPYKTPIKHAMNCGEKMVAGYYVDGYTELAMPDGSSYKIVLEFAGCYGCEYRIAI